MGAQWLALPLQRGRDANEARADNAMGRNAFSRAQARRVRPLCGRRNNANVQSNRAPAGNAYFRSPSDLMIDS